MPSDLYNLNSAYGSVEELKYCIDEMHSQDLLVCCSASFDKQSWTLEDILLANNFLQSYNNVKLF